MIERMITIRNRAGLHARPSAIVVQSIKNYKSSIFIEKGEYQVNAKSIMGVMTLGAVYGTELKLVADGEDEADAIETLVRIFDNNFEEEPGHAGQPEV